MKRNDAERLAFGSTVLWNGRRHRVEAVKSLDDGGTVVLLLCLDSTCPEAGNEDDEDYRLHHRWTNAESEAVQPDQGDY